MYGELEHALGYVFHDKQLLETALTHSSYANETWHESLRSYERLEFLGDSILGFVVADYLFRSYRQKPEGQLTRIRAELVCEKNLAQVAAQLSLGNYLLLGHGGEQDGGRQRESILADCVESILAAAYLDGGFEAANGIIFRLILTGVPAEQRKDEDFKTKLQELVQRQKNQELSYCLTAESGPDHMKTFTVEVCRNGEIIGTGSGSSKKRAEQAAAEEALEHLYPQEL